MEPKERHEFLRPLTKESLQLHKLISTKPARLAAARCLVGRHDQCWQHQATARPHSWGLSRSHVHGFRLLYSTCSRLCDVVALALCQWLHPCWLSPPADSPCCGALLCAGRLTAAPRQAGGPWALCTRCAAKPRRQGTLALHALPPFEWQSLRRHATHRRRFCSHFDWQPRCCRHSFVGSVCAPHKHGCSTAVPSPHLWRGSPMPPRPGTPTRPTPAESTGKRLPTATMQPSSARQGRCQTHQHQQARQWHMPQLAGPTCVVCIVARVYAGDLCGIDHVPDLLRCLHGIAALLQLEARVIHLHHPRRQPLQS
jgi:hypothetical protein